MALRWYSVLDILLPSIITITTHRHWTWINVVSVLWRCVKHVASPIDNLYFHYNTLGLYVFNWPISVKLSLLSSSYRKYAPVPLLSYFSVIVCLRCLLHHIVSLIAYTFRENGNLFSLLLCSLWWVIIVGYVLACRSYLFVCTVHHLSIIIVQTYLKTLNL